MNNQTETTTVTIVEKPRCRFDMFVRFHPETKRSKPTFCYRGDYPDITEPRKMLCGLLRFFFKSYSQWKVVELYDNTKPKNDPERVILKFCNGVIETNRLGYYEAMVKDFPFPDWFKI